MNAKVKVGNFRLELFLVTSTPTIPSPFFPTRGKPHCSPLSLKSQEHSLLTSVTNRFTSCWFSRILSHDHVGKLLCFPFLCWKFKSKNARLHKLAASNGLGKTSVLGSTVRMQIPSRRCWESSEISSSPP